MDAHALQEFTMTHDPDTGAVVVTMLVQSGQELRRYEYAGTYNPETGESGPSCEFEETIAALPSLPSGPPPSSCRLFVDVTMNNATSTATLVGKEEGRRAP